MIVILGMCQDRSLTPKPSLFRRWGMKTKPESLWISGPEALIFRV